MNLTSLDDIIDGKLITKEKRHEIFGKVAGGTGSRGPEIYQRKTIEDYTGIACPKTNMRINLMENKLKEIAKPNINVDGFNYSEDFDGCQQIGNKKIYINMKCIVGTGGNQTRSLREVYWFIRGQLQVLKNTNDKTLYFANILDGDEAHDSFSKFDYLLQQYAEEKCKIYVGDLKNYIPWFKKVNAE
jgi:hypothetical protein